MEKETYSIKQSLPVLLFIVFIIAVLVAIGIIAVELSPPYKVELIKISSGSPPEAELEVYARKEGNANIKISLFLKGTTPSASGSHSLSMLAEQLERVVIPLHIHRGQKHILGKEALYSSIKVTI